MTIDSSSKENVIYKSKFQVTPVLPFRLDLTVWALRREPNNELDCWDGVTYRRDIAFDGTVFEISVRQVPFPYSPSLDVEIISPEHRIGLQTIATKALNRLLGVDIDVSNFYRFVNQYQELKELVTHFRGVKPPRFLSLFETLVNGFLFQQVSLPAGMTLLNHLVNTYDLTFPVFTGHAFPLPENFVNLTAEDLRPFGISRQKAKALSELSSRIMNGLNLEETEVMNDEDAVDFLCQLRGVGRWTAQYFLLRGLGRLQTFPGDDVGARNKIKKLLKLEHVPDYEQMHDISKRWHPFGGMVYFHLLLKHLEEKGYLNG
jgi:DNA-3-methyladenine glycosylase II